jgi:hypothetical protein
MRTLILILLISLPVQVNAARVVLDESVDTTLDGTSSTSTGKDLRLTNFANWAKLNTMLEEIYQSVEDMESSLGTAAILDVGTAITNVVQVVDDGDSNPVIPFAPVIDASSYVGNLDTTVTTLQKLADAVDELVTGDVSVSGAVMVDEPDYSDSVCVPGTFFYPSATTKTECVASGMWATFTGVAWSDPTPGDPDPTLYDYILEEDFSLGTIPSGWSVESGDSVITWVDKMAYTYGSSIGMVYTEAFSEASNHPFIQFKFKPISLPASFTNLLFLRSAYSNRGSVQIFSDGAIQATPYNGLAVKSSSGVLTAGVETYIRIEADAGTGEDSIMTISTSPDGIVWTQRATSTNGQNVNDFVRVAFSLTSANYEISDMRVANEAFNM